MSYKKSSSKVWTAVLAVLLVLVIAGTAALVGVLSDGFKNWDRFKTDEEQTELTEETADNGSPVTDESGEDLSSDEAIPVPQAMTFRSATSLDTESAAYDSVTLTATVEPDSAPNKLVDWTVSFVNPSSEWANGKTVTDYVTVTPSSDGSTTAVVQCLQPFGEQIKITVTSRDNSSASAECTVDFAQRLVATIVKFSNEDGTVFTIDSREVVDGKVTATAGWGGVLTLTSVDSVVTDYTVSPVSEADAIRIEGTDEMAEAIDDSESFTYGEVTYQDYSVGDDFALDYQCITLGDQDYTLYDFSRESSADDAITAVRSRCDDAPFCTIFIRRGVNSKLCEVWVVAEMFGSPVSSVTLDNTAITI